MTYPDCGSTTISCGWSRSEFISVTLVCPSKVETEIVSAPASTQYKRLATQSIATPLGSSKFES